MATQNLKTQSGNRIQVEFDNKQIGLVQSVRLSDSYGLEPASGIGDIHTVEHVPSRATHSVEVSTMVLFKKNMRDSKISTLNGDGALQGIVFDIVVYSKDSGQRLRAYKSCSYDSGSVDVQAHRIVVANGSFRALDVEGEGL